jgi:diguanylate cyclase (GGDEF)-like protein
VLLKPGKLNDEEWELMRQHPVFSADIIQSLFSEELVLGVRHHHERYDGKGYPDGLAGEAIPEMARAMCVVDSYDAMSFQRTYRSALNYEQCLAELRDCRGKQFDPDMVDTFLRVLAQMEKRREIAAAAAEDAAMRIDPDKHILLTTHEDAQRPEYEELCRQLREVRDAHPPVRFITTHARVGNRYIVIGDGEEEATGEKSQLGEEIFTDDDLHAVLAGERLNMNTLFADEFGVWINALAMVRDGNGKAIAIVDADLPPFATASMGGLRSGSRQALASMLQTAARRGSRTEIDAITDGLTGLYNHRYLHERLAEQIERAHEESAALSLLFCNLDHFKQFNDERGHSSGDKALRAVAHVLEQAIRRVDLATRFGGEEFVVVLMDTALDGALEVAERIRSEVHQAGVALGDDAFTISIGVATFPDDAQLKEELLDKAEWTMHLAKRRGRDQVVPFAGADAGQFASAAELDQAPQA